MTSPRDVPQDHVHVIPAGWTVCEDCGLEVLPQDPVEQAIAATARKFAVILPLNLPEDFPEEETVRRLSPILFELAHQVREPLLYTSDDQAVGWKKRALDSEAKLVETEADLAAARADLTATKKSADDFEAAYHEARAERDEAIARIDALEAAMNPQDVADAVATLSPAAPPYRVNCSEAHQHSVGKCTEATPPSEPPAHAFLPTFETADRGSVGTTTCEVCGKSWKVHEAAPPAAVVPTEPGR